MHVFTSCYKVANCRCHVFSNLLSLQVECANLIVLNKVDTVSERYVRQLELVLRKLNRTAEVRET
jgi:G3E family GTPase